jgi:hypothetical protein
MKTIQPWIAVVTAVVILASNANAGHHDRGGSRYEPARHVKMSNQHPSNWVVPFVIGGVLGYAFSQPRRESVTYLETPSVIYAPQPTYQEQWLYFSDCDCQRKVLVRVP